MLRYNTFLLFFVLAGTVVSAQLKYYADPVKIPVSLSGNFGELRPDHFHMGLDFRTERRTGVPVYASAAGQVSRIAVSPTGYGRTLYVDHPNGTTTVYAHLLKFRDDLEAYVKEEQYLRQSFAVDLQVFPGKFSVVRDEQIALSGNSGSSAGPHLHYEIRDTPSQDALNPLRINNFNVTDKTPPRITAVQFYPLDNASHVEFRSVSNRYLPVAAGARYTLKPGVEVKAYGRIGVSVKADDFFDNNQSPCGVYTARLLIGGEEVFSYTLDRIAYSQNRYLNSHIDYGEFIRNRERFVKMWRDPGNRLNLYNAGSANGVLQIDSGKVYAGEILLSDVAGNTASFKFQIRGVFAALPSLKNDHASFFRIDTENEYREPGFELYTPAEAFYEDFDFYHRSADSAGAYFSPLHQVHFNTTPVHKPLRMKIRCEGLPDSISGKAFVVLVDDTGMPRYAGGTYAGGWIETSVMEFGNYTVGCDTLPPVIVPLTIKDNALTDTGEIRFKITDDFSGIRSYRGMIDGEWALFEYDPRYARLSYRIDTRRIGTGKRHTLELRVTDRVDNTSVYQATFWK